MSVLAKNVLALNFPKRGRGGNAYLGTFILNAWTIARRWKCVPKCSTTWDQNFWVIFPRIFLNFSSVNHVLEDRASLIFFLRCSRNKICPISRWLQPCGCGDYWCCCVGVAIFTCSLISSVCTGFYYRKCCKLLFSLLSSWCKIKRAHVHND